MSKKDVVSIEDRIPKLKQARKKKANRRLIFYLSIFFFLISIIVYMQSPLSDIKEINVSGNIHITDEDIVTQSGLTMNSNIWMIETEDIEKTILKNPIVDDVQVNRSLPWTVNIELVEHNIIGYVKEERTYIPVLKNGVQLDSYGSSTFHGNSPVLIGFNESEILTKMASELNKLDQNIAKLISEIYWKPSDDNKYGILLYMNDGYIVDGTIRDFAEKMDVYPSVVSQLEPNTKGIIHMGVGVYFESLEKNKSTDEKTENNETE